MDGFHLQFKNPVYVGGWTLGGLTVSMEKKPNWFKRKMMKLCFGFEWKDFPNSN
jgi:hypothetical protein